MQVRILDKAIAKRIKRRAKANNRSVPKELDLILREAMTDGKTQTVNAR